MDFMALIKILDRPVAFHRALVDITGNALDALFLSQCIYWTNRLGEERDGWFFKSADQWSDEVGMSRSEQERARRSLKASGVLLEKKAGIPCTLHYKVDIQALEGLLNGGTHPEQSVEQIVDAYRSVLKELSRLGYARAVEAGVEAELVDYEEVFMRDEGRCHLCKKQIYRGPGQKIGCLQFDHVHPIAKGGKHILSNVFSAHAECNLSKGSKTSFPDSDELDLMTATKQIVVRQQSPIKTETTQENTAESVPRSTKARPTLDDLKAFCVERGFPASDGEILFEKWSGTGWRVGQSQIMDWKATVRAWEKQHYLPSQKQQNGNGTNTTKRRDNASLNLDDRYA